MRDHGSPSDPSRTQAPRRRTARAAVGDDVEEASPTAASMLDRQRTAGNAAVIASSSIQRSVLVQRVGGTISADTFNQARSILANAGSDAARKTHPKHGGKEAPRTHAQALVDEAQDDETRLRRAGDQAGADVLREAVRRVKAMFGLYGG